MRCIQYFYMFVIFGIIKSIFLTNTTYRDDDKKDIEIFVSLLNVIPTWELPKIEFSQSELKQIEFVMINSVRNPEDQELNSKLQRKMTAIKCTYGYAVQTILLNLKRLFNYETSSQTGHGKNNLVSVKNVQPREILTQKIVAYNILVSRMLSVLYMAKCVAANWLWTVFIMLNAVEKNIPESNKIFDHGEFHDVVDHFVVQCTRSKYLEHIFRSNGIHDPEEQNVDNLTKTLYQSDKLMEHLGLVTEFNYNLTTLFKYQKSLGLYNFFWNRSPFDGFYIPKPKINYIDWQEIQQTLANVHRQVQGLWFIDPFSIVNYFTVAKDVISINILYHILKHFMVYINFKSLNRPIRRFIRKKKHFETIEWFIKSSIKPLTLILDFLDLCNDTFYTEILGHMNDAENIELAKFQTFITAVAFKLETHLKRFNLFNKNIYQDMAKEIKNINIMKIDSSECSKFLFIYYNNHMKFISINYYIANWFSMSEYDTWILDTQ